MECIPESILRRVLLMQPRFDTVKCVNSRWGKLSDDMKQEWATVMKADGHVLHPKAKPSPRQCAIMISDLPKEMLVTAMPPSAYPPTSPSISTWYPSTYHSPTSPAYSPTSPLYSPTSPPYSPF